jgi:Na+-transporting methylmalonyl-CoA/oxaloacetate decarboxylase gamma subunit
VVLMNQKGQAKHFPMRAFFLEEKRAQAFSVFELMIAGVVAFAILIILLMVVGGVGTTAYSDAKTVIANAVKTASPSGEATTQDFVLKKTEGVDVSDLAVKTDLDEKSMFFAYGIFGANDGLQIGNDSADSADSLTIAGTYLKYTGATQKKLAAKVICKQTSASLSTALSRLNQGTETYNFPSASDTDNGLCEGAQPCCAIVLIRSSK